MFESIDRKMSQLKCINNRVNMTNWIKDRIKERNRWDKAKTNSSSCLVLFLSPLAKIAAVLSIAYGICIISEKGIN